MQRRTFVFTTQNPKASRYLLFSLVGFLMIFGIYFMPFFLVPILVFGLIILGFVLFTRNAKAPEEITLYEDHLNSQVFGKVYYKDIIAAGPVTIDTREGLKLKLRNGKKAWWKALKKDEMEEYNQFVAALSIAVQQVEKPLREDDELSSEGKEEENSTIFSTSEEAEISVSEEHSLGQEIRHVQEENKDAGSIKTVLLVLMGILLAVYGLFKIYAPHWEEERNVREMAPVREAVAGHWERTASLQDSTQAIIEEKANRRGPYYLFTNDTTARVKYIPKLDIPQNYSSITSLVNTNKSDALEEFLAHPDSIPWRMAMFSRQTSIYFQNGMFDVEDTTQTYLYFAASDPTVYVPTPEYIKLQSFQQAPDSLPYLVADAIPIYAGPEYDFKKVAQTGYIPFLRFVKEHQNTVHYYVAAREGEVEMTKKWFDSLIQTLKTEMGTRDIDTTQFVVKTFNSRN